MNIKCQLSKSGFPIITPQAQLKTNLKLIQTLLDDKVNTPWNPVHKTTDKKQSISV